MYSNVFDGTLNLVQSINLGVHFCCKTFYGTVNQLLINLVPFIRDALLEFVNTGNLASIKPVLHDPPDLVIHRIQIWAIQRSQIWRNKVECLST